MNICYTVPEIWCVTDVIVIFHFGLFFALLPTSSPKNKNFKKMEKKIPGYFIILHICTNIYDYTVPEIWCATDERTDGRMDGRKKWHIEVGTPPKKNKNIS